MYICAEKGVKNTRFFSLFLCMCAYTWGGHMSECKIVTFQGKRIKH